MPIRHSFIGLHTHRNKQPINVLWCFLQNKFYLKLRGHDSWQKVKSTNRLYQCLVEGVL
jgi:hypothetical protein